MVFICVYFFLTGSVADLDGFFYSFQIPQIGKEFDLLKFADEFCLNIELKSVSVSEDQIVEQLRKNRHYLGHLGKQLRLYSIATDTMSCYKLSSNDELFSVEFDEIVSSIKEISVDYSNTIDDLFRASDYLVSPLNTPTQFIQGKYFLTQAQEEIKKSILCEIDTAFFEIFFHLTGRPGTGKTLLLYDLAKTLSKKGKTLIIHCGKLSSGQYKIRDSIDQLSIISAGQLRNENVMLADYRFILVDETHRIYIDQFETICDSVKTNGQVCIFSSDPGQILSNTEKQNDIANKIKAIPLDSEYTLSEKIRTNKEIHSFVAQIMNLNRRPSSVADYSNIELNYANTVQEAHVLLEYYCQKGYTFINYSKSNYHMSPYSAYAQEENYDTHHVIGQEFDKIVMVMDSSFYYDENGLLKGIPHPNPNYLYPNLFYQGITRVRESISLIIVGAPELFKKIITIVDI